MNSFIIDSSTFKRLEFLDLEISAKSRSIITCDKAKFTCAFDSSYKHIIHSDNSHLNSITDLFINLGYNLEKDKKHIDTILKELTNIISEGNKLSKKVLENFDYIKDQNNQIIFEIKNLNKNFPVQQQLIEKINYLSNKLDKNKEASTSNSDIDKLTSALEKLNLGTEERPRKTITPPVYKFWTPRK